MSFNPHSSIKWVFFRKFKTLRLREASDFLPGYIAKEWEPGSVDTQDSVPGEVDSACCGDIQGWKALGAIYTETLSGTWQEEQRSRPGRELLCQERQGG